MCTYDHCCTCDALMIMLTVDMDQPDKEGGQGHAAAKVLHICKEKVQATAGVKSVDSKPVPAQQTPLHTATPQPGHQCGLQCRKHHHTHALMLR